MIEQVIRRPNGQILGRIWINGDRQEARTAGGVLLGWYEALPNKTRLSNGTMLSLGNTLTLLFDSPTPNE